MDRRNAIMAFAGILASSGTGRNATSSGICTDREQSPLVGAKQKLITPLQSRDADTSSWNVF